jgi:MFS superfamily sulfate permease-like transporter
MRNAVRIEDAGEVRTIRFEKDIFFFHKGAILAALDRLPEGTKRVIVDAGSSDHVELDVREAVFESRENVERQGAALEVVGLAPVDG